MVAHVLRSWWETQELKGETKIEGGSSRLDLTDWTEPLTWADPRAIYLDMCIDRVHHLHLYVFKKGKSSRNNRFFFFCFFFRGTKKCRGAMKGFFCSPQYLLGKRGPLFYLSALLGPFGWPSVFWEGERERATPRRVRLLCTRSLAAKGQRDSARPRCETWLETCQSGRKEGWAKLKVPKNQKNEYPSTKKDRHVHIQYTQQLLYCLATSNWSRTTWARNSYRPAPPLVFLDV